jgi:4-amino-4-deoxy-L-arabinose transferase-like glycosyltransferase
MAGVAGVGEAGRRASPGAQLRSVLARPGHVGWGILLAALALRVGFVLSTDYVAFFDPADYDRHARSMLHGHGYPGSLISGPGDPTAYRMPLFPLFLAGVYAIAGESWEAARLAQALLGTVTVGLIGALGWRLFDRRVGLAALALAAAFPPFIVLSGTLMSENLLLPLELAAVLAILEHRRSAHRYRWAAVGGLLCGLAMLTRPNAIVLAPALAAGVWSTGRWRAAAVLLVAAAMVYSPWPIRNALTLHDFVPLSTELGLVATSTYNQYSADLDKRAGQWVAPWQHPDNPSSRILAQKNLTEPEMDRRMTAEARHYVRTHPTYPAEVGFWNSMRLLHVIEPNPYWHWQNIGISRRGGQFARWGFYPILLLALAGVLLGGVRRAPGWIWLTPVLMWASLVFLNNEPRARAPIDPYFLLVGALGVVALWDRPRRGRTRQPSGT